jgi:hypothetical protein
MRSHRLWIEIVAVATLASCALALLIATLVVVAGAATGAWQRSHTKQARDEQRYEGVVTCSRCGARHSAALGQTAADCARTCVRQGAKFALAAGDKTYLLDADLNTLERLSGQRVSIVGVVRGNTVRVSSVNAPR